MKCKDICSIIEIDFPKEYAEGFDNVGLLIGDYNKDINKILISLEITEKVIDEAILNNIDMIVSHHPLIFKGLKNITNNSYIGNLVLKLIKNNICVYAAHTNFDCANNGMNDLLCEKIELLNVEKFSDEENSIGRIGYLENHKTFIDFCNDLKRKFKMKNIIVSGDLNKNIKKVAVVGGSGTDFLNEALNKNCDCLITGDVKHHAALDYSNMGINIVDLTHFASEIIFKESFKEFLSSKVQDVIIKTSKVEENPLKII